MAQRSAEIIILLPISGSHYFFSRLSSKRCIFCPSWHDTIPGSVWLPLCSSTRLNGGCFATVCDYLDD